MPWCHTDLIMIQADKALQAASGGFSFFGGREEKYQNAFDLYVQAANAFKMAKMSPSSLLCP
jgi:alpha-soluble NSF attachment protein